MTGDTRDSICFPSESTRASNPLIGLLARRLREHGVSALRLQTPSGQLLQLGVRRDDVPVPQVRLNHWRGIARGWLSGLMGWAEGYMAGDWDCDLPTTVTDWAMANEARLEAAFDGSTLSAALHRIYHRLRDNSRRGSRRNIAHHYDLGNAFYRHWLDETMSYSSALYRDPSMNLAQAQSAKYDRVLDLLGEAANGELLEIGCGWGGFAEHWARHRQGRLHGITLSREQLRYARERLGDDPAAPCTFGLTDYRDVDGVYDGIVSIEMFEAVGEAHWTTYFDVLRQRLRPGGVAVLQVISIADERFETYRRGTDFIQRYIFPGGMLPSPSRLREAIDRAGLRLSAEQRFGADYARTLSEWHTRFRRAWPQIREEGFDERFRRMWGYYLAYCESGFRHGAIDVGLYRIERP